MNNYYKRIENPFNDPKIIDNLIDIYCDEAEIFMYFGLTKNRSKNKIIGKTDSKSVETFNLLMFNYWKAVVHKIRCANYLREPKKSKIDMLDNYLQSINPRTIKELDKLTFQYEWDEKDTQIKKIIDENNWNRINDGWVHVDSSLICMGTHKRQKVEHRLYLNCDSTKTHFFSKRFAQECFKSKLSFYFKFDECGDRADTIVIYSDTEHLPIYEKIINKIIRENNLQASFHEPPLLTGKIGPYIGYGSEPKMNSFNYVRAQHLEKCMRDQSCAFIRKNADKKIRINGRTISYRTYIVANILASVKKKYLELVPFGGLTREQVNQKSFSKTVIDALLKDFNKIIDDYEQGNDNTIPYENTKIIIDYSSVDSAIRHQVKTVCSKSDSYKKALHERILNTAYLFDIDKDNYAVALSKCELLGKNSASGFNSASTNPSNKEEHQQGKQPKTDSSQINEMFNYNPMTDAEIEESRRKIGMI